MTNPFQPPDSVDPADLQDKRFVPLRYRVLSELFGFLIGGGAAFVMGYVFITTPLQRVLGPRYSEFDFFGVIGVTIIVPLIAFSGTAVAVRRGVRKLRATFRPLNLLFLVFAPQAIIVVLALFVDGDWAWMGVIHLAACVGILSAAGLALLLTPSPEPTQK